MKFDFDGYLEQFRKQDFHGTVGFFLTFRYGKIVKLKEVKETNIDQSRELFRQFNS